MSQETRISKVQIFVLLSLIAVFVLAAPHIIRLFSYNSTLMGDEAYYHARVSQQTADEGIIKKDSFVYGSRNYAFSPYHIVLAALSKIFGIIAASKLLPFACGALSAVLFYFILKCLGFSELSRITASIAFLLSPIFIYIFVISTPLCVAITLDLLGFYFFIQRKGAFFAASIAVFFAASFFSPINLAMIVLFLLAYTLTYRQMAKRFYLIASLLALVFIFYYTSLYFSFGLASMPKLAPTGLIQQFVTDLGGTFGFGIFALLLSGFGLSIARSSKKRFYHAYITMLLIIILSFFYNNAAAYANFIISLLAGITLASLIKRKWKLAVIRNFSIILVFCCLLFSALSFSLRISSQQPANELIGALNWIRQNSEPDDVVFSHYKNGFWIEFQAQRVVVADSLTINAPDFDGRIRDSLDIFNSWDIKETRKILEKYNASLVLITKDMTEGLVWEMPEQGLAYLVRNSETFKKEYGNSYAGVWRYIYTENG